MLSKLAIFALLCAVFLWPLGFLLGIIALIRLSGREDELRGTGLAIAAIVIGLVFSVFIGGLAALTIPNFIAFQCRAKQSEAKIALQRLHVAELAYEAEHARFGGLDEIEFELRGTTGRYEIRLASVDNEATPRTFLAEVTAREGDLGGDTWTIDQESTLTNVVQGCQ